MLEAPDALPSNVPRHPPIMEARRAFALKIHSAQNPIGHGGIAANNTP